MTRYIGGARARRATNFGLRHVQSGFGYLYNKSHNDARYSEGAVVRHAGATTLVMMTTTITKKESRKRRGRGRIR